MIVETLRKMQQQPLEAVPQPEAGVTYAAKIAKDEAALDFSQPALELGLKIRAFNPFPGACGQVDGVTIKIWAADVLEADSKEAPGQVLAADAQHGIIVACGGGPAPDGTAKAGRQAPARAGLHQGFPAGRQAFRLMRHHVCAYKGACRGKPFCIRLRRLAARHLHQARAQGGRQADLETAASRQGTHVDAGVAARQAAGDHRLAAIGGHVQHGGVRFRLGIPGQCQLAARLRGIKAGIVGRRLAAARRTLQLG
jgi:hypothetical protein